MILVTGAGGKTGQAIVAECMRRGLPVRAWLKEDKGSAELSTNSAEFCYGDLRSASAWETALYGDVQTVYHICPNMFADEEAVGRLALTVCRQHNISHFVYHSVLHPQIEAMPHHWQKMRVEEQLFASGLPFTIVQPTAYMQNLRVQWPVVCQTGRLVLPYPTTTPISLVDLQDVAEAIGGIFADPLTHLGATYELVGTVPLSQTAVADTMAQVLGRPVTASEQTLSAWQAGATDLPTYARDSLLKMFRNYAEQGLVGNPAVLSMLLGRQPIPLKTVLQRWLSL